MVHSFVDLQWGSQVTLQPVVRWRLLRKENQLLFITESVHDNNVNYIKTGEFLCEFLLRLYMGLLGKRTRIHFRLIHTVLCKHISFILLRILHQRNNKYIMVN